MSGLSMAGIMLPDSAYPASAWQSPEKQGNAAKTLLLVDGLLEPLAGGESGQRLGVDLDLLAVLRTAAGARLALARQEGAEADHGDPLALRHVLDDCVEQRVHGFARRRLADIAGFGRD